MDDSVETGLMGSTGSTGSTGSRNLRGLHRTSVRSTGWRRSVFIGRHVKDYLYRRPQMAKLTTKERKKLPASDFGGPDRSYPMPDKSHARDATARASANASPAVKARVDAKADRILGKKSMKVAGGMTKVPKAPLDAKTLASMKSSLKM